MSTHKICLCGEIRKMIRCLGILLSRTVFYVYDYKLWMLIGHCCY